MKLTTLGNILGSLSFIRGGDEMNSTLLWREFKPNWLLEIEVPFTSGKVGTH